MRHTSAVGGQFSEGTSRVGHEQAVDQVAEVGVGIEGQGRLAVTAVSAAGSGSSSVGHKGTVDDALVGERAEGEVGNAGTASNTALESAGVGDGGAVDDTVEDGLDEVEVGRTVAHLQGARCRTSSTGNERTVDEAFALDGISGVELAVEDAGVIGSVEVEVRSTGTLVSDICLGSDRMGN